MGSERGRSPRRPYVASVAGAIAAVALAVVAAVAVANSGPSVRPAARVADARFPSSANAAVSQYCNGGGCGTGTAPTPSGGGKGGHGGGKGGHGGGEGSGAGCSLRLTPSGPIGSCTVMPVSPNGAWTFLYTCTTTHTCHGLADATTTVLRPVRGHLRRRAILIDPHRFRVAAGRSQLIHMRMNRVGMRLLRAHGSLNGTVIVRLLMPRQANGRPYRAVRKQVIFKLM
jgi:hypothetical protein